MRHRLVVAAVLAAFAFVARPARADDDSSWPKLMEAKAPTVVTVKSVLKISWEGAGGDREQNDERNGVVVDPSGVVMMSNFRGGGRMRVAPKSMRVVFEGDEKEYDAILGATDRNLGLAFVRVKDLAGKKIASTDMSDGVEMKLGDEVMGVVRTDQGFDYAPYFGTARLNGQVTKPRTMWLVTGFTPVAQPLYTAQGKVAGVVVQQAGISEEGSSTRTFLLPTKAVTGIVTAAVKACAKALEDAKAQEAEGAGMSEPAMDEPAMEGDGAAGMGEPAGMGA